MLQHYDEMQEVRMPVEARFLQILTAILGQYRSSLWCISQQACLK